MFGGFTGLGSLAGNLLAGRSFGDSAKAGLISGFTAGTLRGVSNKMAGKTFMGDSPTPTIDPEGYQAAGMDIVPTEGSPPVFEGQYAVPREAKMLTDYSQAVKPIEEPLKSTVSNVIESQTIEPRTLTGGLKEVGSAIAQDFNPMTKSGLMNIASKGLTGDIGASVVESQNMAEQAEQQAENELADMGYTFSGFGDQRVITDPSGVTLPATLTAQQILARALGGGRLQFAERTAFEPVVAAQGGLIELAQGGEFSGMVPGQGGGMDDNVFMPIKEGREQVGTLAVSPTEYVVDSYTMAALGDGNPEEGARVMDKTIKQIRKKAFGTTEQPNEIDGLAALKPMVQGV
jgi:hypothetical protein